LLSVVNVSRAISPAFAQGCADESIEPHLQIKITRDLPPVEKELVRGASDVCPAADHRETIPGRVCRTGPAGPPMSFP
jgi:hypothetical protein